MQPTRRHRLLPALLSFLLLAPLLAAPAYAASDGGAVVGDGLVLDCVRPEALQLRCNYRLTGAGQPLDAAAAIGGLTLPPPAFAARTGAPGDVAVLLLVDTSDPGRAAAIRKVIQHVGRLVDEAQLYQRFGLAAFDRDLRMLAPIGSEPDAIKAAAATLEATGRTTELYRNVMDALKLLATVRDPHKVLVVMSDGLAEDRAYFHSDAVAEANRHGIAVYGVGYPRSVSLSVGLQSLRRLADETGGRFVASNGDFELPESFFQAPFAAVENTGALSVDLGPTASALPEGGTKALRVTLDTSAGTASAVVPVQLPATSAPVVKVVEVEVPKVVEVEKLVEVPVPGPAASTPPPPAPREIPLWYWMAAIGMLALALVVLLIVLLLQRRGPRPAASAPPPVLTTLAHLQRGDDGSSSPITSATFRIGRLSDNDLVLRDASVSRHHAEIRRRRDGSFQVLDLDSMNGVLVNGKRIKESPLADGDRLEIGDVSLTFAAEDEDDLPGEQTVMMKTVVPDQPFPEAAGARR